MRSQTGGVSARVLDREVRLAGGGNCAKRTAMIFHAGRGLPRECRGSSGAYLHVGAPALHRGRPVFKLGILAVGALLVRYRLAQVSAHRWWGGGALASSAPCSRRKKEARSNCSVSARRTLGRRRLRTRVAYHALPLPIRTEPNNPRGSRFTRAPHRAPHSAEGPLGSGPNQQALFLMQTVRVTRDLWA